MEQTLLALSNELADATDRAGRSVVAVHARPRYSSSGVLWRPGIVVTADHAVRREEEIRVTLPDGRAVAAELAGRDPGTDLAVLKVDAAELETRRKKFQPAPPKYERGYGRLFLDHVTQANLGCDFDFLRK